MDSFSPGSYVSQKYYNSFQPTEINRSWSLSNPEVQHLLGQADRSLGKLDMYSDYVPNIELFIKMHVVKEATLSSRIEGTQTNVEDALKDKEDIPLDKRDDWEEVQNYISAMNSSVALLDELPFCSRLIKETHKVLLQGVRGQHKLPGEFRKSQNWIGGASINDATFVPPVAYSIDDLMTDTEKFANNEELFFPEILKIALIHYQFETIHPFLDGNGRVGRLLITLYLVSKGILKKPVLYLSDFFERNRGLYYDNLMRVREKGDLVQWFKFFLVGVIETSQSGIATFDSILKLQKQVEQQTSHLGVKGGKVINYLYTQPIVDAAKVAAITDLSSASTYKLINELEQMGILKEMTGGKRGKQYAFDAYLKLF